MAWAWPGSTDGVGGYDNAYQEKDPGDRSGATLGPRAPWGTALRDGRGVLSGASSARCEQADPGGTADRHGKRSAEHAEQRHGARGHSHATHRFGDQPGAVRADAGS